jgi:hypothetical protein
MGKTLTRHTVLKEHAGLLDCLTQTREATADTIEAVSRYDSLVLHTKYLYTITWCSIQSISIVLQPGAAYKDTMKHMLSACCSTAKRRRARPPLTPSRP